MKAARPVRWGGWSKPPGAIQAGDGILLGVVGAIGVGFFIYGAYLYLTASGAPHQMERGKSAMMTALAGIVLALVAYGVVELVMNAVVDPGIDIDDVLPEPEAPDAPADS